MKLLLILILLAGLLNSIIIDKALSILNPKELKRRARGHDQRAAKIYKIAAYGPSLNILLWLKGVVCAAVLFFIFFSGSWPAALLFIAVLTWLVRVWRPASTSSFVWTWAAAVAPLGARAMMYLQPVLSRLERLGKTSDHHHSIYEQEDLVELLQNQAKRPENRIPDEDLKIAEGALNFGGKAVSQVMTPLRKVKLVSDGDQVGPLLMDELHSSGFSRFPVTKKGSDKARPEIIGTLYIRDLINHTGSAKVHELMDKKVYYVNEAASLRDALSAFIKTHHHLFVVVNNFEEIVGVLTIEDVLEQILGKQIVDEFDKYDDLRAVAAKEAEKEHAKPTHIEMVDEAIPPEFEEPSE